jgi:hypothetical protein
MGLGWGTFFGGLGKILDKLPIQGRVERWRNELENLKKEKAKLLAGKADAQKAARVQKITERIEYLTQLLKNVRGD